VVPLGTFQEESVDVGSVLGVLLDLLDWPVDWSEFEGQLVDRCGVGLTRESLHEARGETSRECEGSKPESEWLALGGPQTEEFIPLFEVIEPVRKRHHGEVAFGPSSGNFIALHAIHNVLQVWRDGLLTGETLDELG
jgi:hypothetical protein